MNLYTKYLNGNSEAFELLYNKYKNKIKYFIFNIVKDYQKSEDIAQEVFIYVMQNNLREGYSFKNYLYLVAKSRSLSYINVENRRKEIIDTYLSNKSEDEQNDELKILIENENKSELINSINELDDKYKNVMYLVKIEGLSYSEVAEILGQSIPNIKNLMHRGKKQLHKNLIKKGWDKMNEVSRFLIIIICIGVIFSGVVFATIKINNGIKGKTKLTPIYTDKISTIDSNKVWCGTFNLVWNDFVNDVIDGKIEFEDGYSELANELNKQEFTASELNENSYFKIHGIKNLELKNKIENGIKNKFNETSTILDKCDWNDINQDYVLYAMLKKQFNYLEKFSILKDDTFNSSIEKVKYFGLKPDNVQSASKNIEVLFYNSKDDFAIKLKTNEGEEVYLYRTSGEGKSFEENYIEMLDKEKKYTGDRYWNKADTLKIPFINVNDEINYDELCGRYIKGTNIYIKQALQTINFELNNFGGSVKSEALIESTRQAVESINREFKYDKDFILYLKEENKAKPYFALKVDNIDVLVINNDNM